MDYIVHGILQARILERVAFPFSKGSSQHRDWTGVSCIAGGSLLTELTGKPPEMTGRAPNTLKITILTPTRKISKLGNSLNNNKNKTMKYSHRKKSYIKYSKW